MNNEAPWYLKKSPEEISEALLLASLQAAGTQLNWNKELFEKYLGEK
jgi:hypothetical protein